MVIKEAVLVKAGWLVRARATMPGVCGHGHAHSGGGRRQRELSCEPVNASARHARKDRKSVGICGKWYKLISMGQGWGVGWGGQGSWERKKNQVKENCGKYHSVIKRNKTVPFAEMWLDLETVIQSEVS